MTYAAVVDRLKAWARPTGPLPRTTPPGRIFDVLLALFVALGAVYYTIDNALGFVDGPFDFTVDVRGVAEGRLVRSSSVDPEDGVLMVTLALTAGAALVVRRRYPLAVLWIVLVAFLLTPKDAARLTFYAVVLAAYSAAAHSPYRVPSLVSLVLAVVSVNLVTDGSSLPTVPTQYVPMWIMIPIVVGAYALRTWKRRTEEERARVSALQRDRAEAERRAVEEERARIARELHDVVTHNVSVMVIQAGAARKVMDASPDQAREALLAVEAGGRAAMSELRHVMGLLAVDADAPGDLAPQPGLDQLLVLVDRVRETGVPVGLTVTGERRPLPSGVELAAYRVVQEALTNTVKHAAGASAEVTVDYGADHLRVEVTDTGGAPDPAATGGGRGLIGLRERLAVYGATLRTGPRLLGGYRVTALIPLEAT